MPDLTEREKMLVKEAYRRIQDRLDRAKEADPDVAYHMLNRVREDIGTLRKTLKKFRGTMPCCQKVRQEK